MRTQYGDAARAGMAVFLGLGVIVPFLNYYRLAPSGSFHSEAAAGIFFFLAVLASVPLMPREQAKLDLVVPLSALMLGVVIAGHWLADRGDYIFAPLSWLSLLGTFTIAFVWGQFIGRDAVLRDLICQRLAWAVVIAAGANAILQLIQVSGHATDFAPYLAKTRVDNACRMSGNVAQANHANTLAWMGLSAVAYLFLVRKVSATMAIALVALLILSSALTTSRTAWVFACGLAAVAFLARRSSERLRTRWYVLPVALIAGLAAASLASSTLLGEDCATSSERLLSGPGSSSTGVRLELARNALMAWQEAPVLGVGTGRLRSSSFAAVVDGAQVRSIDVYAHNILLQFLAELGLVGLIVLLITVVLCCWRLAKSQRKSPEWWLAVSWALFVGLHSLLENAFAYTFFIIPVAAALGAVLSEEGSPVRGIACRPRPTAAIASLFGMAVAFAFVFDYNKLTRLEISIRTATAMGAHESPVAMQRFDEIRRQIHIYSPYADLAVLGVKDITAENLEEVRQVLGRVVRMFPTVETTYYQVLVAMLDGDLEQSADKLRKMQVFFPREAKEYMAKLSRLAADRSEFLALTPMLSGQAAQQPTARR